MKIQWAQKWILYPKDLLPQLLCLTIGAMKMLSLLSRIKVNVILAMLSLLWLFWNLLTLSNMAIFINSLSKLWLTASYLMPFIKKVMVARVVGSAMYMSIWRLHILILTQAILMLQTKILAKLFTVDLVHSLKDIIGWMIKLLLRKCWGIMWSNSQLLGLLMLIALSLCYTIQVFFHRILVGKGSLIMLRQLLDITI